MSVQVETAVRVELIESLLEKVERYYVLPEIAEKIVREIRAHQEVGVYDGVESVPELCALLTKHLVEVSQDKHMRLEYVETVLPMPKSNGTLDSWSPYLQAIEEYNYGVVKLERLNGNVGYFDLRLFYPSHMAGDTLVGAMSFLANTNALIIDLRKNGSGGIETVQMLVSYLLSEEPVHLNTFHWGEGNRVQEVWSLPYLPGKRYVGKPVYVLTSSYTFSGGEELAYDLQALKRATIIGEQTGGGANPGDLYRLTDHVHAFIPNGQVVHPITGTNWEGVGVTPDIKVPADQAFDVAYEMALKALLAETEENPSKLARRTLNEVKMELEQREQKRKER